MLLEKVFEHRNESFGIREAFIFIGRVGFLSNDDIRMGIQKIFVIKADIPDNAKSVCHDAEFKSIAEMPIDIHLLDGWVGGSMGRHGAIGSFIRVKGIVHAIGFFKGFELFDDMVGIFRIIFRNPSLNARGVKEKYRRFLLINTLAYGFGQVNKPVEHRL